MARCTTTTIGLDVHSRGVHSCESVFIAENDEGCDHRGRINSDHAGRIDAPARELRATCSASCARPAARAARSPAGTKIALETGTSAFFVARELARLNLKP